MKEVTRTGWTASLILAGWLPLALGQSDWTGGGTAPLNWSDAANWVGSAPPNDGTATIRFNADQGLNPVVDAVWHVEQIQFQDDLGDFSLSGATITITPSVWSDGIRVWNNVTTSQQTISNNIVLGADATVQASSLGATPAGQLLRLAGNINLGSHDLYYHGEGHANAGAGVVELAGIISGSGRLMGRTTCTRPQTMRLLGDNDFTGGIRIERGGSGNIWQIGHNNAIGTGSFAYDGSTTQINNPLIFEAYGGTRTLANDIVVGARDETETNWFTFRGDFVLNGDLVMVSRSGFTWRQYRVEDTVELNGDIRQSSTTDMSFRLRGNGTFTLNGDGTYKEATFVGNVAGTETTTLVVNGALTESPEVTVRSSAQLRGTGIVPAITVQSGGILHPGSSTGTLTAEGDVTLADGAVFRVTLGVAAGESSRLHVDGGRLDLTAGGAELRLYGTLNGEYTLAIFDDQLAHNYGAFDVSALYLNDSTEDWDSSGYFLVYNNDSIQLIPEPGSVSLLAAAGLGLLAYRRRRR